VPEFDLEDLRDRGFVGFIRFGDLSREDSLIPTDSGVYVLVADAVQPEFLPRSPAGWWKGRDPTLPIDRLATEWVDGVPTVYIGKADSLRSRLDLLTGFARGEAIMHWGDASFGSSGRQMTSSSPGGWRRTSATWSATSSTSSETSMGACRTRT
jgi:hypothetical protein